MQKGENGVINGFAVDLASEIWYAECIGAAEKPTVILPFYN